MCYTYSINRGVGFGTLVCMFPPPARTVYTKSLIYGRLHGDLNHVRLPIPPPGQMCNFKRELLHCQRKCLKKKPK
jgi:hypothetical protein